MLSQRIISLLVFEILQTLGEVIKLPRIKRESQIKSSLVHLGYRLPFLTIIIYLELNFLLLDCTVIFQ